MQCSRCDALAEFIDNYTKLMDLWDWSLQKAGHNVLIKAVMSTFHFLFNYFLGKIILKQADNLSKTLKSQSISAAQG